ncbi:MAG: 4a-hydroxytetrahydrobiopterin dehydratase [Ignavibacteriales bacterium]|nr:4a-hydroxytetrahydrobiopterin dehydratase [Ignavibacteriales bacterium]
MDLLTKDEIQHRINLLNGWVYKNNSITKEFKTKNFVDAVSFLLKITVQAEKMDHHPDVLIHSYNKIKITLSTHSDGGVTENDIKLAKIINEL